MGEKGNVCNMFSNEDLKKEKKELLLGFLLFPVMCLSTPFACYPGSTSIDPIRDPSSWTLLLGNQTQDTSPCSVIIELGCWAPHPRGQLT